MRKDQLGLHSEADEHFLDDTTVCIDLIAVSQRISFINARSSSCRFLSLELKQALIQTGALDSDQSSILTGAPLVEERVN